MISLAFAQGLMELLDLDCTVYLDRDSVPYPNFSETSSVSSVFPEDEIIFIDKDIVDSPLEFYIMLCINMYDLKLAKENVPIVDRPLCSRVFASYIIKTVLDIDIESEKSEEFLQTENEIALRYPQIRVRDFMYQFYDDIDRMNEMFGDENIVAEYPDEEFDIKKVS